MEELRKRGISTSSLQQAYEDRKDSMIDVLMTRLSMKEIGHLRAKLLEGTSQQQQAYG